VAQWSDAVFSHPAAKFKSDSVQTSFSLSKKMVELPADFKFPPCPWTARLKQREEEFLRDIAPIMVDFVWGPDRFGYESSTDMFQRPDGVIQEREILTRVTDLSRYPERWIQFMGYDKPTIYGPRWIPERVIVNEPEGSPLCPIEISDDEEEEEFVPAKLSDAEDDE
jgi:hypothetical protein